MKNHTVSHKNIIFAFQNIKLYKKNNSYVCPHPKCICILNYKNATRKFKVNGLVFYSTPVASCTNRNIMLRYMLLYLTPAYKYLRVLLFLPLVKGRDFFRITFIELTHIGQYYSIISVYNLRF